MNEENIGISFELKSPKDFRHSTINTIVLLLRDIADLEDCQRWDDLDTAVLNDIIEKAKRELDNLKIIKFEEDKQC